MLHERKGCRTGCSCYRPGRRSQNYYRWILHLLWPEVRKTGLLLMMRRGDKKNWRCQGVVHSFLPANVVEWHKYTLVPQFRTLLIALLIVLELLNLCNFIPAKISIASLTLHILFTLVLCFWFMQFDLQLTIHLSIFFNFTGNFIQLT